MMKKTMTLLLVCILCLMQNAFAYSFSGPAASFGQPTETTPVSPSPSVADIADGGTPPPPPEQTVSETPDIRKPAYYADGSMGKLSIPKIKLTVKVYHGETAANMKKGAAHFKNTSAWDGNVAFAGHNRGVSAYFGKLKTLSVGDKITYTTPYGTRTYKVSSKKKISSTNTSVLGYSTSNNLTLITCVENVPSQRWCIRAKQVA